jgi:hypothetical protein
MKIGNWTFKQYWVNTQSLWKKTARKLSLGFVAHQPAVYDTNSKIVVVRYIIVCGKKKPEIVPMDEVLATCMLTICLANSDILSLIVISS